MASSKEYLTYVLDLLREVKGISYKYMMSEYILYKDGVIFGGIYDNRFLIKKTNSVLKYDFNEAIPYPSAKPMLVVDIEDPEEIKEIVLKILKDIK
ncbi:MAG: transcriptional regulator [Bacilli bacterium]|nr:transcriptional regulator [Bacilli bacterium]